MELEKDYRGLKRSLSEFFGKDHTDLEISVGDGPPFEVHRNVVCTQSEQFKWALEAQVPPLARVLILEFTDINRNYMEAILQFMYDGNYTVQELNYSGVTGCIEHHDRIEYHGSIYILAGSLAIRGLKELVIHKFHQLLREDWNDVRDSIFDLLPSLSTDDKLLRPLQIKTAVERMGDLLGDKSIVDLPKWEYHAWGDIVKAFKADRAEKVEFQTSLLDSDIYSDIEVLCANGEKRKCHKLVLSQSEVLAKSFDSALGGKEGVIELTHDEPDTIKAMLEYLYTFDYSTGIDDANDKGSMLLFHVSMYAIGEIYAIGGLKHLSRQRFLEMNEQPELLTGDVLAPAIKLIYESTPGRDRNLRDTAVCVAVKRLNDLLKNKHFIEMMDDVGPFGKDLLLKIRGAEALERGKESNFVVCRWCGVITTVRKEQYVQKHSYNKPHCTSTHPSAGGSYHVLTHASLFDSKLYSDIEVICSNGQKLKCHKLVLSQSKVLANSFSSTLGMKESRENVVRLTEDPPEVVKAMIRYLYTSQYTAPKPDDKLPALLFHISVYVIGEVYALSGLKKAAIDAFRQSAKDKVPGHILAPVIQAIYESTPDRDRGLRDAVVQVASKRFKELLVDEKFSAMMDEIGSFGKDILLYTNGLYPPGPMLSVCPTCHYFGPME
ncbi:hypothetical protein SLS57_002852 [Botryosphaeria dothidea]